MSEVSLAPVHHGHFSRQAYEQAATKLTLELHVAHSLDSNSLQDLANFSLLRQLSFKMFTDGQITVIHGNALISRKSNLKNEGYSGIRKPKRGKG